MGFYAFFLEGWEERTVPVQISPGIGMNKFAHLVLVSVGLSSGLAFADTLTVDDDGGADFTSITAAVNFASTGDTILVNAGLYEEGPISFLGKTQVLLSILFGRKQIIQWPSPLISLRRKQIFFF